MVTRLLCRYGIHKASHNYWHWVKFGDNGIAICAPADQWVVCGRCGARIEGTRDDLPFVLSPLPK